MKAAVFLLILAFVAVVDSQNASATVAPSPEERLRISFIEQIAIICALVVLALSTTYFCSLMCICFLKTLMRHWPRLVIVLDEKISDERIGDMASIDWNLFNEENRFHPMSV